jgi:hypothetical protein
MESGNYNYTTTNAKGCDSVDILKLTINKSSANTIYQTACDSFIWNGNTYIESGNYNYTTTNAKGCDSVSILNLIINEADANTSFSGNTITANASEATYQWVDCDNQFTPVKEATNQSFTPNINGHYAVIVKQNGCTNTSDCVSVTLLSNNDYEAASFSVYPNPVTNQITLVVEDDLLGADFILFDSTGKKIILATIKNKITAIDIKDLVAGLYFLRINNSTHAEKIVKY